MDRRPKPANLAPGGQNHDPKAMGTRGHGLVGTCELGSTLSTRECRGARRIAGPTGTVTELTVEEQELMSRDSAIAEAMERAFSGDSLDDEQHALDGYAGEWIDAAAGIVTIFWKGTPPSWVTALPSPAGASIAVREASFSHAELQAALGRLSSPDGQEFMSSLRRVGLVGAGPLSGATASKSYTRTRAHGATHQLGARTVTSVERCS